MADFGEWIAAVSRSNLVSETDVRTQVAIPLLSFLGYPQENRAEDGELFGFEGRKRLRAKPADVVLFDSPDHHTHRDRLSRGWVADHALVAVELKKPGEPLDDAQGQAQFYSHWAKAAFYVATNGEELDVYRMQGLFDDVRELSFSVSEISRHWVRLQALLGYEHVRRYCAENRIKAPDLPSGGYADYLRALYAELSEELLHSIERTVTSGTDDEADVVSEGLLPGGISGSGFAFPVGLSGEVGDERWSAAPYARLLGVGASVVVLSEPGGGKTRLIQMIAADQVRATQDDPAAPVPVILKARSWGREFGSVADGVRREIESFAPGSAPAGVIEDDLAAGRLVVLVDGLDEAPRAEADLLRAELGRVASRTGSRLLVTCRRQDYRGELRGYFGECNIDPLTDEQIAAFAARELAGVPGITSGAAFLHCLGRSLEELVRNPLFLLMTVAVMRRGAGALPENRAELYRRYAHVLLTEWERHRMTGRPFEVDSATKAAVLGAYARNTWRSPPDDGTFAEAVMGNRGLWDAEHVRDELLRSGLLRQEAGGPEFFHPSFREYFFAVELGKLSDGELARFAEVNCSDDTLAEVFAFLVGLLEDEDRQALVLDRLEVGNLYVFGRCLRTRARSSRPEELLANREGTEHLARRYLKQLRATHVALVDAHFGALKAHLPPWRLAADRGFAGREEDAKREVTIAGYLATDGVLGYELKAIDAPDRTGGERAGDQSDLVTLGLGREGWGIRMRRYRDLRRSGMGLDSARETALENLTESVEKLLKKKLPLGDNHPLGVEYVEEELEKLRNAARWGWGVPREFRNLSLRRSLEEVVTVVDRALNVYGQRVTFAKERTSPATGYIQTHVDFVRIREYLGHLEESGLDPATFLKPEGDLTQEDRRRMGLGPEDNLVDKWYSDEAIALYIGRHYDLCQSAYRWIAEHHFPSLKDQMGFYRVGPVRHRALIFRNLREVVGLDRQDEPSWVFVDWEPVASEAEARTVCEVTHNWPPEDSLERFDLERSARRERVLQELGRATTADFAPMWARRSHALTYPMGAGMTVHDEVYKQLEREIVKQLMRGKGSRLP